MNELPACPVETALMMIGDKWVVLILRDLLTGTKRFGELQKSLGKVLQKVLADKLRSMEERGMLVRVSYPEIPPRVEYTITDFGRSLSPVLDSLSDWGTRYKEMVAEGNAPGGSSRPRSRSRVSFSTVSISSSMPSALSPRLLGYVAQSRFTQAYLWFGWDEAASQKGYLISPGVLYPTPSSRYSVFASPQSRM